jgi:hypothetical protein
MAHSFVTEPLIDICQGDMIISNDCKILDLNLVTMDKGDVEFTSEYELTFNYDDKCHALVSWFDTDFKDLQHPIILTTSPYAVSTHWKQVVFYMEKELIVRKGEVLKGSIAVRKSKSNFREIDVKISYHFEGSQCTQHFVQLYKVK